MPSKIQLLKISIVFTLVMLSGFSCANIALAQTVDQNALITQLQKQIQQLLSQVQALQKEVTELKTETGLQAPTTNSVASETTAVADESVPTLPEFTRSLSLGTRGDDVRKLQEFLARDREIYPEGLTTGYYGPKTVEAVKRWQKKNNVETIGIVGPKTIAKFRELGQGVVQGLIEQGARKSQVVPPGLLTAPGIQRQLATTTPAVPLATTTPILLPSTTTTPTVTTTSTPFETIPAVPTIPAIPAQPTQTSAVPATPAVPAQPTTITSTPGGTLSVHSVEYFKWGAGSSATLPLNLVGLFKYKRVSNSKALNVYIQYPGQTTYTKYTYIIPVQDNTLVSGADNTSLSGAVLDSSGVTSWMWGTGPRAASTFVLGTYKFYVTVIDTSDREGPASAVLTNTLSQAPVITSPANGATISGFPFMINILTALPGQYYRYYIYGNTSMYYESPFLQQTSVTISSNQWLTNGNTYQVRVMSYDNAGGAFSTTKQLTAESSFVFGITTTTTDTTAPSTPTNLSAAALLSTQINLAWASSTDNVGIAGYKIYRNGTYITSASFTTYANQNLTPATAYTYTVAAYDAAGNVSAQSISVTATTPAGTPPVSTTTDTTPPTITLAVGYPNLTTQTQPIYIGFNASEEVKVVYEYGLTTSYGSSLNVWDSYRTTNGIYLPTLSSGTTYHIRAKATDLAGNIGYSQDYTFTTASPSTPPAITSGPNHTPTDATPKEAVSIGIGTSSACDSSFQYGLSTAYGNSKTPGDSTNKTSHYFYLTGLAANATYYYKITCVGTGGTLEQTGSYTTGNTSNTIPPSTTTATTTATTISNPSLASIIETLNEILQKVKVLIK